MVDIFVNRIELLPADETADQHRQNRKAENDIVEADRVSEKGLFRGCFSMKYNHALHFDEEDNVLRCRACGHEYIGGGYCENCGEEFTADDLDEIEDFSDMDGDSIEQYNIEFDTELDAEDDDEDIVEDDMDEDSESEMWHHHHHHFLHHHHHYGFNAPHFHGPHFHPLHYHAGLHTEDEEDEDPTQSDQDFIHDDQPQNGCPESFSPSGSHTSYSSRQAGSIQDGNDSEDFDEGGDVSRGRRRPRFGTVMSSPSVTTVTDGRNISDVNDTAEATDSEDITQISDSEESDTNTMVGNQVLDETPNVGRYRKRRSHTPRTGTSSRPLSDHSNLCRRNLRSRDSSVQSISSDGYHQIADDGSDADGEAATDRDGDTEMSMSPSESSDGEESTPTPSVELLGEVSSINENENESSDDSVQPARRRHPRLNTYRTPGYNPYISALLAQHQSIVRDASELQNPYHEERAYSQRMGYSSRFRSAGSYQPSRTRSRSPLRSFQNIPVFPQPERPGSVQRPRRRFDLAREYY